jgi:hypothetical protein
VIAGTTASEPEEPPATVAAVDLAPGEPGSAARMLAVVCGLFVAGGLSLTVRKRLEAARASEVAASASQP